MEVRMDIRVLIISFVYTSLISSLPINHIRHINIYGYLSKYGYILETNWELKSKDERIKEGLIKFQKYHDIPRTGVLDTETLKFVMTPRCGVADNIPVIVEDKTTSSNRIKPAEYKVFADRWRTKKLKWYVTRYTNQVTIDKQRSSFRKALSIWEEVSQLEFVEQRDNVDIEIQFVRLDHGDESPFDGPSRGRTGVVLAHAFPPGGSAISGDAHFDNDEKWTADIDSEDKDKKYLELIAAHEFGHSLGLDHSRVPTALMSAYYVNSQRHYELHEDDIEAIQSLYGAPSGWKPRTTPKPTPPPPVPVCHNLFTAVVWGPDKRTYGIYNDKVIELADKRGVMAIPRSLQDVFPGSPIGVDFAITLPDGSSTFMFRGKYSSNKYLISPSILFISLKSNISGHRFCNLLK
ncbi:matrix metalloproteinase-9 [Patella vulgata]|uniref:matrix metalloproteinase-9 n=1 Tax=Patella vulgata TaxID=6465 RepID=UPI0024A8B976|nr:matrix metalloproteinase-9 [Patella vulgata]